MRFMVGVGILHDGLNSAGIPGGHPPVQDKRRGLLARAEKVALFIYCQHIRIADFPAEGDRTLIKRRERQRQAGRSNAAGFEVIMASADFRHLCRAGQKGQDRVRPGMVPEFEELAGGDVPSPP